MLDTYQESLISAAKRLQLLNDFIVKHLDKNIFNPKLKDNKTFYKGMPIDMSRIDKIVINGCGGTGGWFIPKLIKILNDAKLKGKLAQNLTVYLIDGGIVESKNIIRQNFINRDIGKNKAFVMYSRYSPLLVDGIDMVYVDKYISTKNIIDTLDPSVAANFVDTSSLGCFKPSSNIHSLFAFNFVDNAVSRKIIHNALSKFVNNTHSVSHCLDVGNNLYSGQAVYSRYSAFGVFASSNYYYNYPEELNDHEFIKLDNCADADLAQNNPEQLFMANDMAATISANILASIVSDEVIYYGLVKFTTGSNASITNCLPQIFSVGATINNLSKCYVPNSFPCIVNGKCNDLEVLISSIVYYLSRNNSTYMSNSILTGMFSLLIDSMDSFNELAGILDNAQNPYFKNSNIYFDIKKYIDADALDLKEKLSGSIPEKVATEELIAA